MEAACHREYMSIGSKQRAARNRESCFSCVEGASTNGHIMDRTVWLDPWWLQVRIDGKVGYIREDDFCSMGLPAAG
jgi:hypothetical protein